MEHVYEYTFPDLQGRDIRLWTVYFDQQLFSFSYAAYPQWQIHHVDFPLRRD